MVGLMDEFVGKKIKLVFDDQRGGSVREGILTGINEHFVILNRMEAIPLRKIIRMEVVR